MKITDAKVGVVYKEASEPYIVLKYSHTKMGRGTANIRLKVKNLITGVIQEKTYMNNSTLEEADVAKKTVQFLYKDNNSCSFMDMGDYSQFIISNENLTDELNFLRDGMMVVVTYFEDKPIAAKLATNEKYQVTYTEPGTKGDTSGKALKPATIDTGATVMVPLFINHKDEIIVNTDTGEYVERA